MANAITRLKGECRWRCNVKLLRELTKKPWLTPGAVTGGPNPDAVGRPAIAATGVWVYVCVATVMFSLVVAAYVLRLGNYGASPEEAAAASSSLAWWTLAAMCGIPPADDWNPLAEPGLLWLNTGILVLNGLAWQFAHGRAQRGLKDMLGVALIVSGVLTLVFLLGQLAVWRQLIAGGHIATAGPANAFFYLVTAMHGLHLLGGLIFWGRTTSSVLQGAAAAEVASGVRLCAVYWHYLLIVWVILFGLLLIT